MSKDITCGAEHLVDFETLLLVANFTLAAATIALAAFTAVLWKATNRLGEIEDQRDKDLARSRKLARVTLKIDLAEKINREASAAFMPGITKEIGAEYYHGKPPEHTTAWFRQLYRILDYRPATDGDGVSKADLERIFSVWDELIYGVRYLPDNVRDVFQKLESIQNQLKGVLPRWRNEVVELTAGED